MFDECCPEYAEGMKSIVNQQIYCSNRTSAPQYEGKPFRFCPWCSRDLLLDKKRETNENTERA